MSILSIWPFWQFQSPSLCISLTLIQMCLHDQYTVLRGPCMPRKSMGQAKLCKIMMYLCSVGALRTYGFIQCDGQILKLSKPLQ